MRSLWSISLGAVLTLLVLGSAPPVHAQAAILLAQQGSQLDMQNRNVEESEARRRARIRMELAIGYFQEGRFNVALDELKQSLTADPNFAEAIGILALVYMELGQKDLAEQNFRRAMQLKPNDSDLNVNYGWFLCVNGRERDSIAFFLAALKNPLYERPSIAWQNAGLCSMKLKDMGNAETYLRRAYEIDPDGPMTSVTLARIYFDRGEVDQARFMVSNINRSPSAYPGSLWLGLRIERKLGNAGEASALAATLRRAFPNSPEAQRLARGAYDE